MVELLATFGVAAKELFEYNREMYQFDQTQRLDRELLRMEMQIKRFDLFREDIRDLVELTVGKMEMYHVVGALLLECTVIYFTEARVRTTSPSWLLTLYWLTIAGTFTYVLLCVWFSMYASISSHSFGVRLLCRFVRLPIPGSRQIAALNARLTDFERQGAKDMLRVPFIQGAQQWQQRRHDIGAPANNVVGKGEGDSRYAPAVVDQGELKQQDLLASGIKAFAEEGKTLHLAAANLPGKHIKLFRELQAKWQGYDAYSRVSMSLGINHLCMTASYYVINLVAVEYRSPSVMFGLVCAFQCTNLALAWLDVAGLKRKTITALELMGAIPPLYACSVVVAAPYEDHGRGQMKPTDQYHNAFVIFFLIALWLEGLLHLAWPSTDIAMLPKRYRSVLFLDVFGVDDSAVKGVENRTAKSEEKDDELSRLPSMVISVDKAIAADEALCTAEAAVRRWEELPEGAVELDRPDDEVKRLRRTVTVWRKILNGEAARRARAQGDTDNLDLLALDTRSWSELAPQEQAQDPFAGTVLGPFQQAQGQYYYDLETQNFVRELRGREVLSLKQTADHVQQAETIVQSTLTGSVQAEDFSDSDLGGTTTDSDHEDTRPRWRKLFCRPPRRSAEQREHRLPWRVLCTVTRMKQLCWITLGIVFACEENGGMKPWDILVIRSEEERRLEQAAWVFEPFDVSGQVSSMSAGSERFSNYTGGVLVTASTGSFLWGTLAASSQALALEAVPQSLHSESRAATAVCGAAGPCLLAIPVVDSTEGGIKLLQLSDVIPQHDLVTDVTLRLSSVGSPWLRVAGALLQCSDVKHLGGVDDALDSSWCLLLAGWDGQSLPVAMVPLDRLEEGTLLQPLFDVLANKQQAWAAGGNCSAAAGSEAARQVSGLGLEPASGNLWVLWSDNDLEAFDLLGGKHLGSWKPKWPSPPVSLCPRGGQELVVLGQTEASQPELVRAMLQA
eukprot:TRINITY_DN64565_c0_g1_i2.p1 TRINITY_DN64565_c0_g1~~TRINITY_DN64565_c0_g1_i2.p1  ORF type:complete len:958 (+),score=196.17 TRINITY_DN64565_c0_g1_i2:92-2965(+)